MLFGSGSAKFTRSGSTVSLDYSNIRPSWVNRNFSKKQSIYDHYTTVDYYGDYSNFWIDVNLYQYTSSIGKFNEIYPTYLHNYVYFWPHNDGYAISGSDGQPTVFFIREMEHKYLSNDDATKDVLSIHFVSIDYATISGSLGSQAADAEGGGL